MSRLQAELQRLYGDADGGVRAMVLELARPADWEVLSRVWRGVQADLQLPAPAIAVSGTDGLQLWFSLQEPVSADRAGAFLAQLRARYLAGTAPARLRAMPSAGAAPWQAPAVPALQAGTENWSAFVAPDLAPVFAETPWLDIEPGAEGQADLLARLHSIKPAALDAAMSILLPEAAAQPAAPVASPSGTAGTAGHAADVDPARFLHCVLNDETAALALRIEAAKALLHRR